MTYYEGRGEASLLLSARSALPSTSLDEEEGVRRGRWDDVQLTSMVDISQLCQCCCLAILGKFAIVPIADDFWSFIVLHL